MKKLIVQKHIFWFEKSQSKLLINFHLRFIIILAVQTVAYSATGSAHLHSYQRTESGPKKTAAQNHEKLTIFPSAAKCPHCLNSLSVRMQSIISKDRNSYAILFPRVSIKRGIKP